MSSIKYNLVTPDMVKEVLDEDHPDVGQNINYEDLANKLNNLIHDKCLYCYEGESGCQCWNDE